MTKPYEMTVVVLVGGPDDGQQMDWPKDSIGYATVLEHLDGTPVSRTEYWDTYQVDSVGRRIFKVLELKL